MTITTAAVSTPRAAEATTEGFTLQYGNGSLPLPLRRASAGCSGLDIGGLLKQTGHVTLDEGFTNTAACTSAITYIDGDAGILRYRGYPIEQLAEKIHLPGGGLPAHLRGTAECDAVG